MHACVTQAGLLTTEANVGFPGTVVTDGSVTMWVLEFEPRSSGRVASTPKHWFISATPWVWILCLASH